MSAFHPELRAGRYLPNFSFGPRSSSVVRALGARRGKIPAVEGLTIEDVEVPARASSPAVSLRLYRPEALAARSEPTPALYWMHGGGFIIGRPEQDEAANIARALELCITVAAVRYRLAPEHPAPAATEDAYAGLRWLYDEAGRLRIDRARIAIGGASAGGGLCATLAQCALDRGELRPAFQLLVYPMLDDRTALRRDHETRHARVWSPGSNAWAWSSYLAAAPGSDSVPPYSAAARRASLEGLPPAWIGVGTLDLFCDEDLAYAERLRASGVPCEAHVVQGAFHGFDAVFPRAAVTRAFVQAQSRALRAALAAR